MPLKGAYAPGTSDWARRQAEAYEASNGARRGSLSGRPVIVLTTVGAVSGQLRKTALMRVEHDGRYAAIASKGGSARNPKWVFNLRANPHVELQDGPVKRDYRAHEATGRERATWWERAVEAYPPYADYQDRTRREIPVFILEPIDDNGAS